jgi:hypothetical protein
VADEPLLAVIVDIDRWLTRDRELPFETRLQRDRKIGRALNADGTLARVIGWWREVGGAGESDRIGLRVVRMWRLMLLLLFLAGLVTGGFVTSAAMAYDGSYPVNLLLLFSLLVGVPGLFLLLTLLALPGWIPGLRSLREAFSALSLGRWALFWVDKVGHTGLADSLRTGRRHSSFARWQLLVFSQWFAIGFFAGALLLAWLLVAFTDLAFGWSTTLRLDAADVQNFFAWLAGPWSAWLPAAVPDLTLTEASRYVRLAAGETSRVEAVRLGEWWPFVLMVLICYGLLPRLLLLGFGSWRARRATRALLLENSEVTALLDRLDSPSVTYTAADEDVVEQSEDALPALPAVERDRSLCALIWNDALTPEGLRELLQKQRGSAPEQVLSFSILEDSEQWRSRLQQLPQGIESLIIVTKGWEPPLLEFVDFVRLLRENLAQSVRIAVFPVDLRGKGIAESDRRVWARALMQLDDPALYVMDAFTGEAQ